MTHQSQISPQMHKVPNARRALLEKRLNRARDAVTMGSPSTPGIHSRPRRPDERIPLSYAQERLWFLDRLNPGQPVYNIFKAMRITGPLDRSALERSLDEIVRRHEVLRTSFTMDADLPVQVVAAERRVRPAIADLGAFAADTRNAEMQERLQAEIRRPFDLEHDPLLRVLLVRLAPEEHVLLLTMHHIVSDGWSLNILFHELAALYDAFSAGRLSPLPHLPIQYADYALWERSGAATTLLEKSLAYWREQLGGGAPALELPTDYSHPAEPSTCGAVRSLPIPRALTEDLKSTCRREGVTLFMLLITAFQTLLHRYTGQDAVTIGTAVAGRSRMELEKLIGFFVNTVVIRGDLAGNPTFRELLGRTRETTLGAFAHQDLPFARLVRELQPERSPGRNPFFDVMFVLQNADRAAMNEEGLGRQFIDFENGTAKFDLTLSISETADGLTAAMEYRTDLFEADTITRILGHYRTLLEAVADDPGRPAGELPLLGAGERKQLVETWNNTAREFPRDRTVHSLFEAQAARAPGATALVQGRWSLSYGELNQRANQLAHRLRRLGVGPDTLVALCLERSQEMVVALLGILKAGGAYVSLDPSYPAERLAFMLADSRAPVVITVERLRSALPPQTGPDAPTILRLDSDWPDIAREDPGNPAGGANAENLAYVSYTSGSTGKPKGVCIPHRAVNRLLLNTDYIRLGPEDAVAQISNCAFDASTFEIWGALLHGCRLVILPPALVLAPREFAEALVTHGITTMFVTTALFNQLAQTAPGMFRPLRDLLFGGEAANSRCVRAVLEAGPPARLLNVYGPTECTTFATWFEVRDVPAETTTIPIGRPIANTTVYVLDGRRQPVPVGVPGELYIGGDGLARGYLRRPDLDADRFVPHPFSDEPGDRLYRTGDRVRRRPDGAIEFLGRVDLQVKIRGYRVEPEEIETALELHPAVRQAVVAARKCDHGLRLVAYVVADGEPAPTTAELWHDLRKKLPEYMVPSAFVFLPALPLNANGKVERTALPAPQPGVTNADFAAPRTDVERRLAALWEQALDVPRVGLHDNFFELGGHSLAGVRLFARIEQEFKCTLPLASLFQAPTVGQLAQRLLQSGSTAASSSLVALQPRGARPPIFFMHGAGGNLWTYANLVPHLGSNQPVYGLESRAIRKLEEYTTIEEMATHYLEEIRTIQPRGPYFLGGYCFGGNVAYEMARQLEARGEQVALLALLDSAPANGGYQRIPWWKPVFFFRFGMNTACWLRDFLGQDPVERRKFLLRKLRAFGRRFAQIRTGRARPPDDIDLDEVIDVSRVPEIEIQLWKTHLRALRTYRPGPYHGRITLLRTRGQPFLCSFDPHFGWGALATRGVEIINLPGAHEMIFMEPHVRVLSARLRECLNHAQATAAPASSAAAEPIFT